MLKNRLVFHMFGAGNEIRTRDLNLGKVALYQLSYSRKLSLLLYSVNNNIDQNKRQNSKPFQKNRLLKKSKKTGKLWLP